MLKVGKSRNQCRGCGLYFGSNSAFEGHRTGTFGVDRRCRTPEEMQARGFSLNMFGYWVGASKEFNAKKKLEG